jgi:hypothetical protein
MKYLATVTARMSVQTKYKLKATLQSRCKRSALKQLKTVFNKLVKPIKSYSFHVLSNGFPQKIAEAFLEHPRQFLELPWTSQDFSLAGVSDL